ncbi:pyridoxal phosphate-dependent aminotransferase [Terriglobus sp.]|uniref:pyridoxal phosphate-dependent aminotransferase n=1 Tax=Terriglobus sp. TaxID=1889013 RepID=UPI003AFFACF6
MHFSTRTNFGSEADPLTEALALRRRAGLPVLDLTESNPTRCGLGLDRELLLPPLSGDANCTYRAEPFGPSAAREAIVSAYYGERGVTVAPEQMVLTASTSEAYSFLFRLFCEPGDHVMVPQPSYPLFDLLARFCDVETRLYPLRFHHRWQTDLHALEAAITPRTRAIVVVHPNNPTGHFAAAEERQELDRLAARHGLPLLVDEVFLDYPVETGSGAPSARSFAAMPHREALTFVMSGLSKVLALPQMKLAWTLVLGLGAQQREALHRLEYVADTYLSVAVPGANAAASWLRHAGQLHAQVLARVRTNLAVLDRELAQWPLASRLPVEGGWSVLLRLPALEPDGEFALRLLQERGVLVHPGSFFGLPGRGWVVVSLLLPEGDLQRGLQALFKGVRDTAEEVHSQVHRNLSSNS